RVPNDPIKSTAPQLRKYSIEVELHFSLVWRQHSDIDLTRRKRSAQQRIAANESLGVTHFFSVVTHENPERDFCYSQGDVRKVNAIQMSRDFFSRTGKLRQPSRRFDQKCPPSARWITHKDGP